MIYSKKTVHHFDMDKHLKKRGMTLIELSKAIKLDYSHLCRLRSEKLMAREQTAKKIMDFFKARS